MHLVLDTKNSKTHKSNAIVPPKISRRKASGQAIVQGTAAMWLIVTIGLSMFYLLLNVGLGVLYQEKINHIAKAAADHLSRGAYWLGMAMEPETRNPDREQEAKDLVNKMLKEIGLPPHSNWVHNLDVGSDYKVAVTSVSFTVGGINTIGQSFSPVGALLSAFSLTASGTSSEWANPAYGTCTLHFRDVNQPGGAMRNIRVPIYFEGIAGCTTTHVLKKGTFVGNPLHGVMVVNAQCFRGDPQHPSLDSEYGGNPTYGDVSAGFPLPWWGYGTNNAFLPPPPQSFLTPPPPAPNPTMPDGEDNAPTAAPSPG
jgi:hypothetical protein